MVASAHAAVKEEPVTYTDGGKKFNLPLKYDEKADQESKAEAAKLFAATLKK